MKFRKLLAAGLAVCSLLTFAACKSNDSSNGLEGYQADDDVILSSYACENGGKLLFESIDSDTVRITGYNGGPVEPHEVVIPAEVPTAEDGSTVKRVTRIDDMAFYSMASVKSVVLPEGLEEIGEFAFAKCVQLESVTIPTTLKTMETGVFHGCERLKDIGAIAGSQLIAIPDWCYWGCTSLTTLTIPANIKTLGTAAFYECKGLTEVTLADGVETLGEMCFASAEALETLTLPATLTNTAPSEDLAFYGAAKLTTINAAEGAAKEYAEKLKQMLEIE